MMILTSFVSEWCLVEGFVAMAMKSVSQKMWELFSQLGDTQHTIVWQILWLLWTLMVC